MKNIIFFILIFLSCSVLPKTKSGYVVMRDESKINFKGHIMIYNDEIIITGESADHYFLSRDIKEIHLIQE